MKKILFAFLAVVLLSAGCSPTQQVNNTGSNLPNSPSLLATIEVSGSTNTLPYTISVNDDGSGSVTVQGKSANDFSKGAADTQSLKNLLGQVPDVSTLTGGVCAKSASFGTVTKITYNGKTSGDISCTSGTNWPQSGYDLSKFVNNLENKLQVKSSRNSPGI